MNWLVLTLILGVSVGNAAPRCPDSRLRTALIGGDTITGGVVLHTKPLKFAQVRLYFSSGKTAWVGTTDKNGRFATTRILRGYYRLEVSGWGNTTVQLNPKLDKLSNGQIPAWNLILMDNSCVGTVMSVN
jgi:hypothetical protein